MFGFEDSNFGAWLQAIPYALHIIISIPFLILLWLFFALIRQVTKNLAVGLFYVVNLLQTILQGLFLIIFIGGLLWLIAQFVNLDSEFWPSLNFMEEPFEPRLGVASWSGEPVGEIDITLEPYDVTITPTLTPKPSPTSTQVPTLIPTSTMEVVPTKQPCRSGMYAVTGLSEGVPVRIREYPGLDKVEPKARAYEGDILESLGENQEYGDFTWLLVATTTEERITGWVVSHFLRPCP